MQYTPHNRTRRNRRGRQVRRWRPDLLGTVVAVTTIAGVLLFTYPTASAWVFQVNQSNIVNDQTVATGAEAQSDRDRKLDAARVYNTLLESGGLLGSGENVPKRIGRNEPESSLRYSDLLRSEPTGMMSRLQIPSIGVDLPVYHGTSDDTLLRGVGHLEGTSLPVGGEGTRAVLTGHRGLASATMFTDLDRVAVGDTFGVQTLGVAFVYRVVSTEVVAPEDREEIRPVPGRDLMTLVTCTPLGLNTHRILVTGERILPAPDEAAAALSGRADIPGFPWWMVWSGLALVGIGFWYVKSGFAERPSGKVAHDARRHVSTRPGTEPPAQTHTDRSRE